MGYRLSLDAVAAAALFAVAWVLCDQLAGLGVGGSSAAAGVLAVVVFGLTAKVTRPERPRVQNFRSPHAMTDGPAFWITMRPRDVAVGRLRRLARAAGCRSSQGPPDSQRRSPGICRSGTGRS